MIFRLAIFLFIFGCMASSVLGQTFQYSRGWTNGKRGNGMPTREACQYHRLKYILEGKPIPQAYWPCEWHPYFDPLANSRSLPGSQPEVSPNQVPSELDD